MVKQTYEYTFYNIEEVYVAIKQFENSIKTLAESGLLIDESEFRGSWDIISKEGNPAIKLKTVINIG